MNKFLIFTPDESAPAVELPHNTRTPLDFTIPDPFNNMLEGSFSGGVFTANVAGRFRFNVSTQANGAIDYRLYIRDEARGKDHTAQAVGSARIAVSKVVTLFLHQGDTVSIGDAQFDSSSCYRWLYADTNRIEISFEG